MRSTNTRQPEERPKARQRRSFIRTLEHKGKHTKPNTHFEFHIQIRFPHQKAHGSSSSNCGSNCGGAWGGSSNGSSSSSNTHEITQRHLFFLAFASSCSPASLFSCCTVRLLLCRLFHLRFVFALHFQLRFTCRDRNPQGVQRTRTTHSNHTPKDPTDNQGLQLTSAPTQDARRRLILTHTSPYKQTLTLRARATQPMKHSVHETHIYTQCTRRNKHRAPKTDIHTQ